MNSPKQLQISIADRYNGAWAEINARLQSRQSVNTAFTMVVLTAIGLMWSEKLSYIENIGFLLPLFGLATALWIGHNDLIIGLLGKFCSECEKIDSDNSIPGWHTPDQEWIVEAFKYRLWTDWGIIIVLILVVVSNFVKGYSILEVAQYKSFLFFISTIPGFLAIWLVFRNKKKRNEILFKWEFNEGKFRKIINK